MPILSSFYGIIIRMYKETDSKHNIPHIHAEYNGKYIVIDFNGTILEGNFPIKKRNILVAWVNLHEEELQANWKMLSADGQYFKIKPLD